MPRRKSWLRRWWVRMGLPSNCWLWHRWLRSVRAGEGREGYSVHRRTRHPFRIQAAREYVPHYLYAERRATGTWRIVSYVPRHDGSKDVVLFFHGRVRWGDART